MKRYRYNKILKTDAGKRYYSTSIFPTTDPTSADTYIITSVADRLDWLADEYYGSVTKWPVIALANNLGLGTLIIPSGMQIRIPAPSSVSTFEFQIEQNNK